MSDDKNSYNGNINNNQNPYGQGGNGNQNPNQPINPNSRDISNQIGQNVARTNNSGNFSNPQNPNINSQNNQGSNYYYQSNQPQQPQTQNRPNQPQSQQVNRSNNTNSNGNKPNAAQKFVKNIRRNLKNRKNKTSGNNSAGLNNQNPKSKRPITRKQLYIKIAKWTAVIVAFFTLIGMALFFTWASTAPNITEAQLTSTNSTQLLDSSNNVFYSTSNQDRDYADQTEIPTKLKDAVVAIEDKRFYKHHGVDIIRTIGSAISSIRYKLHLGGSLQGGSTLTQQLVKLTVFSTNASDQTLKRKAQEAWLAMKVERNFSKDQILTFYINKVNMGAVYGMKTASHYYFDKELDQLTDSQYAILAAIPNAPALYNLYTNPQGVTNRRNLVLDAEVSMGYLTKAQADAAKATNVTDGLVPADQHDASSNGESLIADSYIQSTLSELKKLGYDPFKDNLKVYTNMNMKYQKAMVDGLNSSYYPNGSQSAATLVNPNNGKVLGQVGGRNTNIAFGLNRATQTNRSAGSAIKPLFDYGPATEYLNWPTYRTVPDKSITYSGTNIKVSSIDGKFLGNITEREALVDSRNPTAVYTFKEVGPTNVSKFMNNLGFSTVPSKLYESEAIGYDASTVQLASAYAAFANGGTYYAPQYVSKIMTSDGQYKTFSTTGTQAMKDSTAFMITDMLKGVISKDGTGWAAVGTGFNVAGKTGTVGYDESLGMPDGADSDVLFSGYTKNFSLSIWAGFDEPNKQGNFIPKDPGSSLPARIWKIIMSTVLKGQPNPDWSAPSSVTSVQKGGKTQYEVTGAKWDDGGLPDAANGNGGNNGGGESSSSDSSSSSSEPAPTSSSVVQ